MKHVFVVHDNGALNQIYMGRCFPVAFGPAVPNVSDPSGLNCTDILVADLGTGCGKELVSGIDALQWGEGRGLGRGSVLRRQAFTLFRIENRIAFEKWDRAFGY